MADKLGGKLGTRLADIRSRATLSTMDRMSPLIVKHGMALQHEFFRLTGSEINRTIGPFYRKIAEAEGVPDYMRDLMHFVADGDGQWATMLAGTATSSLIGAGLGSLFTNWLQPTIGELMRQDPNMPLAIPEAAAASVRGLSWGPNLASEAEQSGLNNDRFRVIEALTSLVVDAPLIMQLRNRDMIDTNTFYALLKRAGWDLRHADYLLELRANLISIQDAAAMQNRDIITVDEGRAVATHNGFSPEDFDRFNLLAGEPPDLQTLFLAWRRGVLTESDVDRGIVQGPLRKEWIPAVKELRWVPLPPEQAADAVNQGHMDLASAVRHAEESGVRPEDFAVIVDNAGIPPGPQEALSWVNRGTITEDQFRTIFAESRIKNKYIDLYLDNRNVLLTMAEIRSLFAKGAMTHDQAVVRLVQRGYVAEDASIILAGATAEKTAKVRDLTVGQVVKLFEARLIDEATTRAMIVAAGFTDQEATWYIDLANGARAQHFTEAAIGRIHTLFVGRRIDDSATSAALDKLQVPPDGRDSLLALWAIERDATSKELTTAEVIAAAKLTIYTTGQAFDHLQALGYHGDDAIIKLKIAKLLTPTQTQGDLVWPPL